MSDSKLWNAAWNGDEDEVSQLIEEGAKVDWKGENNWTALHNAASGGHTRVVTRLLDSGWSLEARTDDGFTPLYLAALNCHLETVKRLKLRGAKRDKMLYDAAAYGVDAVVSQVIEQGSYTLDWSVENDWTALHLAASSGHIPVVCGHKTAGCWLESGGEG